MSLVNLSIADGWELLQFRVLWKIFQRGSNE